MLSQPWFYYRRMGWLPLWWPVNWKGAFTLLLFFPAMWATAWFLATTDVLFEHLWIALIPVWTVLGLFYYAVWTRTELWYVDPTRGSKRDLRTRQS